MSLKTNIIKDISNPKRVRNVYGGARKTKKLNKQKNLKTA